MTNDSSQTLDSPQSQTRCNPIPQCQPVYTFMYVYVHLYGSLFLIIYLFWGVLRKLAYTTQMKSSTVFRDLGFRMSQSVWRLKA